MQEGVVHALAGEELPAGGKLKKDAISIWNRRPGFADVGSGFTGTINRDLLLLFELQGQV